MTDVADYDICDLHETSFPRHSMCPQCEKEKLYENYGWLICNFDGDAGECETCQEECNPTYYRRVSFEVDEGEYSCGPCIEKEIEALKIWEEEFEESKKYE